MNCQMRNVLKNCISRPYVRSWDRAMVYTQVTRTRCGQCSLFASLPSKVRGFHTAISQRLQHNFSVRVQTTRIPTQQPTRTIHRAVISNSSTRFMQCRDLLSKHGINKCQANRVRVYCSKAGNVKKGIKIPPTSEFRRLLSLATPERWRLAASLGLLVVSSAVTMSVPFCIGKVIDIIYTELVNQGDKMKERLQQICSILVVIFIIGGLANFGRVYLMNLTGNNIVRRLRSQLFSSIMRQEIGFFDKNKTGELINRLSTDSSLVGSSVTTNISDGLRSVAQAVGGVSMMCYVSPKLAGIALCIVPPIVLMSRFYGRYVKNITKQVQDSLASATQVAEERISSIRTVRSFAQEKREVAAYDEKIDHILMLSYKEALARGIFWGSTGFSGNMIILSVFYSGGLMMTESQISVGDLSAFLLYAAYVGVSIGGMTTFYSEMMRGLGASSRLWYLMDRTPTIPVSGGVIPTSEVVGNLSFNNITFSYPARSDMQIFSDLSLLVPAGSVTAVVGASGSGKSTLGTLLLRFYDPTKGSVVLDQENIRDLDPMWLRTQIGSVSQEPVLFSCSVAENIAYGAQDPTKVTAEEVEEAAKKANAYHFIQTFPEGFNTMVGERGLMLSGGQRQRVAIARAILKDPKILLLDEATSALDAESEYLVQEALERVMVGRTVITIAHRLSTIMKADQIAVLDKGAIAEVGSYRQLMGLNNGMFRKLVERQTITS
ncbi:ATP-binding cassette sub-family B member 10, mitochondrial-like [Mizuhopecten yessoensis]|uniref:ATP-binding cassette sub-family B member 10, mitochondrial-like n=1 Tax=Mizuhopecten yessoensis TaxID=6573 RepID=UPI000B45C1EE|nr:ATP-binding cassette sub-family B member 10, mitochondrial-like [Mizuhopecten yessoensis]